MVPPVLNPLTQAFADPALEAAYQTVRSRAWLGPTRVGLAFVGFLTLVGAVVDSMALPPATATAMAWVRFALILPSVVVAFWLCRRAAEAGRLRDLLFVLSAVIVPFALGVTFLVVCPREFIGPAGYALSAVILPGYGVMRVGLVRASVTGWLCAAILAITLVVRDAHAFADYGALFMAVITNVYGMIECWLTERRDRSLYAQEQAAAAEQRRAEEERIRAETERQRAETLLLNILPPPIAERLKSGASTIADGLPEVAVLFADLVGFTTMSARLSADEVVRRLNTVFSAFDDLCLHHGVEKIKTVGDAYMVAAGLPVPHDDSLGRLARLALDMQQVVRDFGVEVGEPLDLRIGIHVGPVVAGVIGKQKFAYDLWGDTVNTASRMESHGVPGAIQVSGEVARRLQGRFRLEPRGRIPVKGKGDMEAWLLGGAHEVGERAVG